MLTEFIFAYCWFEFVLKFDFFIGLWNLIQIYIHSNKNRSNFNPIILSNDHLVWAISKSLVQLNKCK
jgi:hypothetical protein